MASFVVDYFELPMATTEKSGAFFERAFGWSLKSYGPEYTELAGAGTLGGLNGDGADHSRVPVIGIRTDDIAAAERAIVSAGGSVTRATYDYPGGKRFFFREPGGNELMVYQPGE